MKTHKGGEEELSTIRGKKGRKSTLLSGEPKEVSIAENHHHPANDKDTTARISFLIDFSLAEGEIRGKITHRLTDKQVKFAGIDQATITQFMNKYISRLEKNVIKMPAEEVSPPIHELAEEKKEEARETPFSEMQTRSFDVIPLGTAHPQRVLQQGQPFQFQWSFEPPSFLGLEGEKLNYRVIICRKKLAGGPRELVGKTEGQVDFSETLTSGIQASLQSQPLPRGTYRLKGVTHFWSSKSKKPGWRSSCSDSCLIQVV